MIERNYWQHAGTGEIWAVETHAGTPVRCAGPLNASDVHPLLLDHLRYTQGYVSDLQVDWPAYAVVRLCSLCNLVLRSGAVTVSHNGDAAVHLSCAGNPRAIGGQSVGAAVFVEALWQASVRLRRQGAALRRRSSGLIRRCDDLRARQAREETALVR
jgi:hypothetical protein